ncbi:MAG: hypothetical protein JKY81_00900 [Colwellia sp.]|nr:hypothetical protein [Colwellia sp.]
MTINDEILILANQIANQGNKPTVALIKTKLSKKVALPIIISTLKTWQHQPSFISLPEEKDELLEANHSSSHTASFEQDLHEELALMKKEILELKQLVKQLIDQQKS